MKKIRKKLEVHLKEKKANSCAVYKEGKGEKRRKKSSKGESRGPKSPAQKGM